MLSKLEKVRGENVFYWIILIIFSELMLPINSLASQHGIINSSRFETKIDLNVPQNRALLIKVSQSKSDYELDLYDLDNNQKKLSIDTDAFIRLDELLLITREFCTNCQLVIRPKQRVDADSKLDYQVVQIELAQYPSAVTALQIINAVGEYAGKAYADSSQRNSLLERAIQLAEQNVKTEPDFDWLIPHLLSVKANLYNHLGDGESAQTTLKRVLEISPESIYSIQAHYEISPLLEVGRQKLFHFNQGIKEAQNLGLPNLVAQGENYLAIDHVREQNFQEAFLLLSSAADQYKNSGGLKHYFDVLGNMSWWATESGNIDQAIKNATKLKLLAETYGDEKATLWSLYDLSVAYYNIGNYYSSIELLGLAEERIQKSRQKDSDAYKSLLAFIYEEQAHQNKGLGLLDRATKFINKGRVLIKGLGWKDREDRLTILDAEIKIISANLETNKEAINALGEILAQRVTNSSVTDVSKIHRLLISAHQTAGNNSTAEKYVQRAMAFLELRPNLEDQARLELVTLNLYLADNKLDQARKTIVKIESGETTHKDAGLQVDLLRASSALLEESKMYVSARRKLDDALVLVERQFVNSMNPSIRRALIANHKGLFEDSIRVTLKQNSSAGLESLRLLEKYKARTLLEELYNSKIDLKGARGTRVERDELFNELVVEANDWYQSASDQNTIVEKLEKLTTRLETLDSQLVLSQAKQNSSSDAVPDINLAAFAKDQIVLSYFLGESNSWVWVIQNERVDVISLPNDREFRRLASQYASLVAKPPALRRDISPFEQAKMLKDLSKLVLGPADKYLADDQFNHLIVIADDQLTSVPFSALNLPDTNRRVVEKFQVSYAPSISIMSAITHPANPMKNLKTLVVASSAGLSVNGTSLPNIPHVILEAESIKSILGNQAKVVMPPELNKSFLYGELEADYRVLHIAAHGLVSKSLPALSGLIINSDSGNENIWFAPEISRTKHNLKLVVLSACESNQGVLVDGEGMLSLGRSFLESGAEQVIGTLWQVEDKATSSFMSSFYKDLHGKKVSVIAALRNAQLSILDGTNRKWVDPYYWAGFQLLGRTNS